ncbi:hypothetical protein QFC20_006197 [Naganishia adeliensis]|uniref:Uncharacterized protein n=1 Tax=Naganishia adeliensis TaxID=92952 RepID=A0ACC2VF38_9TREE|nr:hypothetical protein QFC20_006197 [Naganishia adeliensis]
MVSTHMKARPSITTVIDPSSKLVMALLWTLVDFVAASALRSIWRARKQQENITTSLRSGTVQDVSQKDVSRVDPVVSTLKTRKWLRDGWDEYVMALSTTSIDNALTFLSISYAAQVQSQLYPVLLLAPICLVLFSVKDAHSTTIATGRPMWQAVGECTAMFTAFMTIIHGLAFMVAGSNRFIFQTWATILSVSDLTPNVGLSWYFFTEMFDHFRKFFTGVFQLHVLLYVVPLSLRLRRQPLLATVILSGIISVFKSYPTLGDAAVWLGLLGCFPDIWDALRLPLLTGSVLLYSTLLLPILLELWLVSATGNANFLYAATMVHSLGCGLGVLDVLGAALRNEVARDTLKVMDSEPIKSVEKPAPLSSKEAVLEDADACDGPKSANRVLEDRNLVVVQYTTLDEA